MSISELIEHAERLRVLLEHKRRLIQERSAVSREALLRQCDALENRLDEILRECREAEARQAARVPAL